jgi:hypothetical protein
VKITITVNILKFDFIFVSEKQEPAGSASIVSLGVKLESLQKTILEIELVVTSCNPGLGGRNQR